MPTSTDFLQGGQWLRLRGWGTLTGEELISAIAKMEMSPETFRQATFCTTELDGVTEMKLTPEHVRSIVDIDLRLAVLNPSLCVAVIAPRIEVFGMARMWQALADATGWPTGVFRDAGEARTWLDATLRMPIAKA
jgi:hypothetical protein